MNNNKDHIKDYWSSQGKEHGSSHWASWGDNWMLDLEIETIGAHIKDGDKILDVGCANGYSTFHQYENKSLDSITGVDYAANMIDAAKSTKINQGLANNINFQVGDIRKLEFEDAKFDVTYTTRVIINLNNWNEQIQAINECLRVTKPGGKVIFSEGFWEPLVILNSLRSIMKLPPLVEHDFNRYIKQDRLEKYLENLNLSFEIEDFSSLYYLGSRLVRDLATDMDAYPGFSNPINKIFYDLEKDFSGGNIGIQKAVIINKPIA
jgi:ubiquinone/menaquinone biosynthesis C-methylase UbiE